MSMCGAERLRLKRSWESYRMLRGGAVEGSASPRRAPPPPPAPPAPRAAQQDRDHFAFTTVSVPPSTTRPFTANEQ